MTEAEKKMKKYTRAVNRKLNLPSDVKKRVMTDFTSSIQSRKEAGKTDEEIYAELGSPAIVAADLNEQMKEFAYIKSPWRWVCFALIIVCSMTLLYKGGAGLLAAMLSFALFNESVGIIGGVDGPTQIFIAQSQDSMIQGMVMTALVLVMSVLGFYFLGHMRKK